MKSKKTLIVALVVLVVLIGWLSLAVPQWSALNEHKAQVEQLEGLHDAIGKLYDTGRDPTKAKVKARLGDERAQQLFDNFVIRWDELPARA
ncbi:MAG TPA: hypothetical protein EYG57_07860, partial [Planctomycetes bacterium]|nr:hypothetical protein [Planctomycetota bacterium]